MRPVVLRGSDRRGALAPVPPRRRRRGFSLLEVVIALSILTVSLVLLVETQSSAVLLTEEAERMITATDLARLKTTEVTLRLEQEGFQVADVYESGDFADLGDDLLDMEFGPELEDYHWEYLVSEVDIAMIGDLATAAQNLPTMGADGEETSGLGGGGSPMEALSALGIGPDMIADFLGPYVREVHVRVWWGEDSEWAEENGTEVVLTTHAINPTGALQLEQEVPL